MPSIYGPVAHKPRLPSYELITTFDQLFDLVASIGSDEFALDFETTSLSPKTGKVRLASICNDSTRALIDFYEIDLPSDGFEHCAFLFSGFSPIVFNAGFEQRWFDHSTRPGSVKCRDVWYLRCAMRGGGRTSLARFAKHELDIEVDKTEQVSDWDAPALTQEQLDYAFLDAEVTWKLYKKFRADADSEQLRCAQMFDDMVPAVIEMEDAGMAFDAAAHTRTLQGWEAERDGLRVQLDELLPDIENINSDTQLSDYFSKSMPDNWLRAWPRTEKTGQLSMTSKSLVLLSGMAPVDSPLRTFLTTLSEYKHISKYCSSFGESLLKSVGPDGRIHARFNIAAAKTCRFSSSAPNLQQTPRGEHVRQAFVAAPGNMLVSLDYSGIELRVLALLTGDERLLEDCVWGDVHATVAEKMTGQPVDKSTPEGKEARRRAKAVSFGIIYGSSALGVAGSMGCSMDDAQSYIDFWADRYPKAFQYRYDMMGEAQGSGVIRMVDGGTVWMSRRPALPKCANYPVQRAALSVMARALIRHKATLDTRRGCLPSPQCMISLVATIHDALIDEVDAGHADAALGWMRNDMTEGYLDVFPGAPTAKLVEGGIGPSWGELE